MRRRWRIAASVLAAVSCAWMLPAQSGGKQQTAGNRPAAAHPDFSGVWTQYPHISGSSGFADFSFSKEEPPMTPWAEAKYKAAKPVHVGGYKGASDDTTLSCFPPGVPRIYLFNFPMEIFNVPGRVLMVYTSGRFIPMDGRIRRT